MKKIYIFAIALVSFMGLSSCEKDQEGVGGELTLPSELTLPRNDCEVDLSQGRSVIFEWEASSGYAKYEILFDKADGDFSQPLFSLLSDNNGFSPKATVTSNTLNVIAKLGGCNPGQSLPVKWTVMAYRYQETLLMDSFRTVVLTRANTLEVNPTSLTIGGSAAEVASGVPMNQALTVGDTKGKYQSSRVENTFECFTKLLKGTYTIVDDLGRWFALEDGGKIQVSEDAEVTTTNSTEGIYLITLDFNTMKWSMDEVQSVYIWTHPWFGKEETAELTYAGLGEWYISGYAWNVGTSSQKDTRYHFFANFASGAKERWSYWDDDCRNNSSPDSDPIFYNVYRFTDGTLNDDWAHSWKTLNDSQGVGELAEFHVYMNNTYAENYIHTRSFKAK